jgi:hypothetical protein
MEGARIGATVALYRDAARPTTVEDNGKTLNLQEGERVFCNLVSSLCRPARKDAMECTR